MGLGQLAMTGGGKNLIAGGKRLAGATVAAGPVRGLLDFAVAKGADRGALLDASGVAVADLADQDNRIPFANYAALMRAAKALTRDPALALHFGETVDMSEMSIVGLLGMSCETVAEGLAQMNRYGQLIVDLGVAERFRHVLADGLFFVIDARPEPDAFPELTESSFARIASGLRMFAERPLLKAVHFTYPAPAYRAAYDEVFRVPVIFGSDQNALAIEGSIVTRRVATQPRYVFGILSERAEALLKKLESSKTVRGRVEALLMPILHTGASGIDAIAEKMGVSRWTLSRKLKAEGATFEQVLDALRHRLALDYLAGKKVSVNEAAYLVGFSEPAAFSRAFKRWTGKSPREMRQKAS